MDTKPILLLTIAALLFFLPFVGAQLTCDFKAACPAGEADMLHLYQLSDSHAELPNQTLYANRLCCGGISGINNISQGARYQDYDIIIKLWQQTNSHAQLNHESGYGYEAYLSVDSGGVEVRCDNTTGPCSSLGEGYTCLLTANQTNNTHLSDCVTDPFPIRVCCKAEGDFEPPLFSLTEPTSRWINSTSFYVNWTATDENGVDCSNVVWSSDPGGPWMPMEIGALSTSCPTNPDNGSVLFGPSEPVPVQDDMTFYFTGNATDSIGNTGMHVPAINITVDTYDPEAYIRVTDNLGREITDGVAHSDATRIYISHNSTDNISGILNNTLYYLVTRYGSPQSDQHWCGSAPDHGGWSNCTIEIDYNSETQIR